jgi:hypothetical protein
MFAPAKKLFFCIYKMSPRLSSLTKIPGVFFQKYRALFMPGMFSPGFRGGRVFGHHAQNICPRPIKPYMG